MRLIAHAQCVADRYRWEISHVDGVFRLLCQRRLTVGCAETTVHRQVDAINEPGIVAGQEGDDRSDVLRIGGAAQRNTLHELVHQLLIVLHVLRQVGEGQARVDGIDAHSLAAKLQCQ